MMWKAIGHRCAGTAHKANGADCGDALQYETIAPSPDNEVLIACVADGAGGARFGGMAAEFTVGKIAEGLTLCAYQGAYLSDADVRRVVDDAYSGLSVIAKLSYEAMNEYACTLLVCYAAPQFTVFFQIGDGAIVFLNPEGIYEPAFWPENGEYENQTYFLCDDPNFGHLRLRYLDYPLREVALFTDGLQRLALNYQTHTAHEPFFAALLRPLRLAEAKARQELLCQKLAEYLDSAGVNKRTDDDKTLFLATRL